MTEDAYYDTEGIRIGECIWNFTPKECVLDADDELLSPITKAYLTLTAIVFGLFGNVTSIWVLCDLNDTFDKLLMSLALFDTIVICKNINSKHL